MECTVNRVRDEHFDQVERSGHAGRLEDLDLFASLGIRTLRYPVLWERTAPAGPANADWSWPDERLGRLRELGVRPIAGLLHHGSGPLDTDLLDPAFPGRLAEFAGAVARRYPWVDAFTPVNEPLTTARFSCLYGHWYPHARDDLSFARALLTQCRATVLAMRAIREVNPDALLVQTDDLGKTYSTPPLAYQAELENERRWLSYDLLCGALDRERPMWRWLHGAGIDDAELEWFLANPCPPDVVGINHYPASERFLDQRLERYPACTHGGNGTHAYADEVALWVCADGTVGPAGLLREAWERYGIPLAITEVHNSGNREEQLRWLLEVWSAAQTVRDEGVDVRAVTVWSLLGTYDWNALCTACAGFYEPGVFDVSSGRPRATALAAMVSHLAATGSYDHPALDSPGWWGRPDRLRYPSASTGAAQIAAPPRRRGRLRPILVTGRTGTLGRAFSLACDTRALSHVLADRRRLDLAVAASVAAALDEVRPWAVINTAGYVRVDEAELEPERCFRENTTGAATLARECARRSLPLLTFSSDLVFDGLGQTPYVESDAVAPLNLYGRSKAEAERLVLASDASALVVRTSAFFGPRDGHNFVTVALRALAGGESFAAADDVRVSPTYVPDLVRACLDLLVDGESGIWHLATAGEATWAELARRAASLAGLDPSLVEGVPIDDLGLAARRSRYSVLGSERGALLPSLDDALSRYVAEPEPALERIPAT